MALVVKKQIVQDERTPVWVPAATMNSQQCIFTILNITNSDEKWYLEIMPRVESMPVGKRLLGMLDGTVPVDVKDINYDANKVLMSLGRTKGREDDMTAAMDKIKKTGPLYNCYVSATPLQNRHIFYDVSQLPKNNILYVEPPKVITRPTDVVEKQVFFGTPGEAAPYLQGDEFDPEEDEVVEE